MSKDILVTALLESGLFSNRAAASRAYDAIVESLAEALAAGEEVTLRPFGTFLVRERKARTGRDPRSGEPLSIPRRRVVVFRAGAELRQGAAAGADWLDLKTYTRLVENQVRETKRFLERRQVPATAARVARESADRLARLSQEATDRLRGLTKAGKPAWGELKTGLERAYAELREAFLKARGKF